MSGSIDLFGLVLWSSGSGDGYTAEPKGLINGYLDEVRFTRVLRYTENFTPPTRTGVALCPVTSGGGGGGTVDETPLPNKTPTTSIFERLGYSYSGAGVIEFSENVLKTMNTMPSLLPNWAYEDLRTNNVGNYVKNPTANAINVIQTIANSVIGTSAVANTLFYAARDFKEHTDRLCGVTKIDPANTANLPHYTTAMSTGKTLTHLVYQGDGYANSACILGNFTSILCAPELEEKIAGLTSSSTGLMIDLTNYLNERRIHDEGFFANSKVVLQDYEELKKYSRMGSTENHLISNLIATDRLRNRGVEEYQPGCTTADEAMTADGGLTVDNQCPPDEPVPNAPSDWPEPANRITSLITPLDKYYDGVQGPAYLTARHTQSLIEIPKDGISLEIDMRLYPITGYGYHEYSFVETTSTTNSAEFEFSISPHPGDFSGPPTNYSTSTPTKFILSKNGGNFRVFFNRDYWGTSTQRSPGSMRLPDGLQKYYLNIRYMGQENSETMIFAVRTTDSSNPYLGTSDSFDHCKDGPTILRQQGVSNQGIQSYLNYFGECRSIAVTQTCTPGQVNYFFDPLTEKVTRKSIRLSLNQVASIIIPPNGGDYFGNNIDVASLSMPYYLATHSAPPGKVLVNLSECPGDFSSYPLEQGNTREKCFNEWTREQSAIDLCYDSRVLKPSDIKLDRTKTYYLNFKLTELNSTITSTDGTNGFNIDLVPRTLEQSGLNNNSSNQSSRCVSKSVNYTNTLTNRGWIGGSFGEYTGIPIGGDGGQKLKFSMNVGEILSLKIPKNIRIFDGNTFALRFTIYWSQSGIMTQGANPSRYEVCLSECEGDFDSIIPENTKELVYQSTSLSEILFAMTYDRSLLSAGQVPETYALLKRDKDYYLNIRINSVENDSRYPQNLGSLGVSYNFQNI